MDNNTTNEDLGTPLSDDPEENLRLENELLQMKLNAQFGAQSHSFSDLPPDIENQFLKNVLDFETNYAEHSESGDPAETVNDRIGKPAYIPASELDDEGVSVELAKVTEILEKANIEVDYLCAYDDRTKYTFITEELLKHEMGFFSMPGMTTHFIYEEFHPNHKYEIEKVTTQFFDGWFKRGFNEYNWSVGDIVLPEGKVLARKDALKKMQDFFDCYTAFENTKYEIFDTGFELYPETSTGMGHAEGAVIYLATAESGEQQLIKGMFKLYMALERDYWVVCYFVVPGFTF